MSSSASYAYELERQRRRELALIRIRATTQAFLDRYLQIRDDLRREALDEFVPEEAAQLDGDLARLAALLAADPEAARTESQRIAADVHALPRVAREAQRAAAAAAAEGLRQQREAQLRAKEDLDDAWRRLVSGWRDGLARELAFDGLGVLRRRFLAADLAGGTPAELAAEVEALRLRSEARASQIRAEKAASTRAEAQRDAVDSSLSIATQSEKESPAGVQALRAALADTAGLSPAEFADRLTTAAEGVDAAVVDERCRREVVRGVVQALRDAGFVTDAPWRRVADERDEVVVRAQRPAGSQAEFRVTLSGDLAYTFDNYEGSACKKDIGTVLPRLEEIYGVRLSNQRVIWENPDDLDRTARTTPDGGTEGGHGE